MLKYNFHWEEKTQMALMSGVYGDFYVDWSNNRTSVMFFYITNITLHVNGYSELANMATIAVALQLYLSTVISKKIPFLLHWDRKIYHFFLMLTGNCFHIFWVWTYRLHFSSQFNYCGKRYTNKVELNWTD